MKYKNIKKYIITYTENNNIKDWLEPIDEALLLTKNTDNLNYNPWEGFTVLSKKETIDVINWIEIDFKNTINQITDWYTQAEIDTWATKVEEAQKVINGGTSDLLSSLLLEWENLLDFAKKILQKAKEYSEIYYKAEKTKREKLKNIT